MSNERFEEIVRIFRKSLNHATSLTELERHKALFRLSPAEEDAFVQQKTEHSSRASLVKACLDKGAWTLTDAELDVIVNGVLHDPQLGWDDFIIFKGQQSAETQALITQVLENDKFMDAAELKAITRCSMEQNSRWREKRATKTLQRYRLVERCYQGLLQDSIHKVTPVPEHVLKRTAFEQIMRETKGHTEFPRAPTNDSLARKIEDFAIKAQRRPYLDIGVWGFVVLRLDYRDDAAWETFKSSLNATAQRMMLASQVPERICQMLRFAFLEDESALAGKVDQIELVKYWKDRIWSEEVHINMNHDFFFSADAGSLQPDNPMDPAVYLHDASVDEIPTDDQAFPGYIKTSAVNVFLHDIAGIERSRQHARSMWEILH